MKKIIFFILLLLVLSGCSSANIYDIGLKNIEDVFNIDFYGGITANMKQSEVSSILGDYNNYFEEDHEIKRYEYNLDKGILQAVVTPVDNSWHTSTCLSRII